MNIKEERHNNSCACDKKYVHKNNKKYSTINVSKIMFRMHKNKEKCRKNEELNASRHHNVVDEGVSVIIIQLVFIHPTHLLFVGIESESHYTLTIF